MNAKERLDKLISKSRSDLYKPIAIAEILYRSRVQKNIRLDQKEDYRRRSYDWMRAIILELHGKTTSLNSRYWDQTFDADVVPPDALVELGKINDKNKGIVETYIYAHVRNKFAALGVIRNELKTVEPSNFRLSDFLNRFEQDSRFKRSVDKAYEIVVYALFNAVVDELHAEVTLSIDDNQTPVLRDFEDFAELVLGISVNQPSVTLPARLFRIGTTNANDAGLDMWANFGPAVQVKHLSLSADQVGDICQNVQADQVIVVCKSADAAIIEIVVKQLGLENKLRGMITEDDLEKWYYICCSEKYRKTLGRKVIDGILHEMWLEFPLADLERMNEFFRKRNYYLKSLKGIWTIANANNDESH